MADERPGAASSDPLAGDAARRVPGEVLRVPVDRVVPDPENLRGDLGDLEGLADSIRSRGVLQPLVVVPDVDGAYRIVMGHRRHAAAKLAGLTEVPVLVELQAVSDRERVEAMLIENLQREDLAPLGEARGFERLLQAGMSQRSIASRVGRSQAHVSKRLSLLRLTESAKAALDSGGITLEDALSLARLAAHPERMDAILDLMLARKGSGLTVTVDELVTSEQRALGREQGQESAGIEPGEGVHSVDGQSVPIDPRPPEEQRPTVEGLAPGGELPPLHAEARAPLVEGSRGADDEVVWDRREQVRRAQARRAETMRNMVRGKLPRARATEFVLRQALAALVAEHGEAGACELLGLEAAAPSGAPALEAYADSGSERLLQAALAVALEYGEQLISDHSEAATREVRRHYAFLREQGYEPAGVEIQALQEAEPATGRAPHAG